MMSRQKHLQISRNALVSLQDTKLENFVTKSTILFFERLPIRTTFLAQDPETWKSSTDYLAGYEIVKNLQVVNDHAERGVALIQEYNSIITKDEEQKQYLLQVVAEHRKRHPGCSKISYVNKLNT